MCLYTQQSHIMYHKELKKFVQENPKLVTCKPTSNPDIFVLKYTKKVFYDGLWNAHLENCRGTLVDSGFNLISYPFKKIYNYGVESSAPVLADDQQVYAYRKVNGFMCAVTWYKNDILISTTGSIDSDFVKMAKEMIEPHIERYRKTCSTYHWLTFMFECVHPNDPHIIPEEHGMWLLGWRFKQWNSNILPKPSTMALYGDAFRCRIPEFFECDMANLKEMAKTVQHEGFVFYSLHGVLSAKIKSPYYLCLKALARKKDILSLNKEFVNEEFYPMIEHLLSIKEEFNLKPEQDRLDYIRAYLEK